MTHFRGHVAFEEEERTQDDRRRAGAAFFSPGLDMPRVWYDEQAALALAQRRVTEEDGRERQPTPDAAGRVILFSGYLFDPVQVIAESGMPSDATDSTAVAAWVDRHGFDAVQRLKGDYTFALWEPRRRYLDLVVSPMAMRGVYWHSRPKGFWFATIPSALHQFPGVPRELDPLQLTLYLTVHVVDPGDTVHKGIRLLPPGTHLSVTAKGVRERAFWRPDPNRRVTLPKPEDYAEAALELLDRAVKVRMRARRTPAILMSGGLDSSAVAASAALLSAPGPVRTYTAVPHPGQTLSKRQGWYDTEQDKVEALAALYPNLRPRFCHSSGPAGFEEDPTPFFVTGGRPFFQVNHIGWFDPAFRAARAEGHDVLMVGTMGNLSMSFDGLRGMSDIVRAGRIDTLLRLAIPALRSLGRAIWPQLRSHVLTTALPPKLRDTLWRLKNRGKAPWTRYAALSPHFAREIGFDQALWAAGRDAMFLHQADSRDMQADFLQDRRNRQIETTVTLAAHYGFDLRDPYVDQDLVDFCIGIPRDQYLWGGQTRSLMRRALTGRMPSVILDEQNFGQQNPEWFDRGTAQRESFAAEIERLANVPLADRMLDLPRLKRMIDTWPADAEAAQSVRLQYQTVLPRAVQIGRFIRWSEGGNH